MSSIYAAFPRRWLTPLIVLAIAATAVFGATQSRPAAAAEVPRLSAVEIADGVLFNTGPAAEYLQNLNRGETDWSKDLHEFQAQLHDAIRGDDEFVQEFPQRMQSGDPQVVDKAMHELGELTLTVLYERYGHQAVDETLRQAEKDWVDERLVRDLQLDLQYQYDYAFARYRGTGTGVVVAVAVAAVVAAVVAVAVVKVAHEFPGERTNLLKEVLVSHVASGLARDRAY